MKRKLLLTIVAVIVLLGLGIPTAVPAFAAGPYTITASAGAGGSISPSGAVSVAEGASQQFIIPPDLGYYVVNVVVDSVDKGSISSYTFTNVIANHTITASFALMTYTLEVSITGNGTVEINPPGGSYLYGTVVTLTAIPDTGSSFLMWDDDLSGSANPATITMDYYKGVTAIFLVNENPKPTYTLEVIPVGSGTVTQDPLPPYYIDENTVVTLTAVPGPGWVFSEWDEDLSGTANPATITMDYNHDVLATFTQVEYILTVNKAVTAP